MRLPTIRFLAVLTVSLLCASSAGAQQLSLDRESALRAEVKGAFDQYTEWFAAGRADLVAQRSYRAPVLFLRPSGLEVDSTAEAVRARFEGMIKTLNADGYAKSEMSNPLVSVFSEHAGSVSSRIARYRRDGTVIAEIGATFVFAKTSEGWRIVSMISHDPARAFELSK